MNYSEQVFKMLRVEPNEEFGLKETSNIYKLDENLNLLCRAHDIEWLLSEYNIQNILLGTANIIKIIKPTHEDQIIIDYARLCGCNWITKDEEGSVCAFYNKPVKDEYEWTDASMKDGIIIDDIRHDVSFLSWEDEEPYYIGE